MLEQEQFLERCKKQFDTQSIAPHESYKQQAWTLFEKEGLPSKKSEPFQHVPLQKVYTRDDSFLEGSIEVEASSSVRVMPLSQAAVQFGAYIQKRMQQGIQNGQRSPFSLLNYSLSQEGRFIYIPKGVKVNEPLRVHVKNMQYTQLFIFADEESEAQLIITPSDSPFYNGMIDINVEKKGRLDVFYDHWKQTDGIHLVHCQAQQKKESQLQFFGASMGSQLTRFQFDGDLLGENSHADFQLFGICHEQDQLHSHVQINHRSPLATSNQLVKHLLFDRSKTSFTGRIYVEKEAQQTNAYQLNRNLLLSSDVAAHSKPGLEIFADDVKASHGATVATIDEDLQFYFQSRGISLEEARHFLIRAFSSEMIDAIFDRSLKEKWGRAVGI